MGKIVKKRESCGGVKIGECTVQRLLFADDFVLLDSTQNGLQQALDGFSDACSVSGMKIRRLLQQKQKSRACPDSQSSAFSKMVVYHFSVFNLLHILALPKKKATFEKKIEIMLPLFI